MPGGVSKTPAPSPGDDRTGRGRFCSHGTWNCGNQMNDSEISFSRPFSIALPKELPDAALVYSLVADEAGRLYCTDELNHSVFSFNSEGQLRWQLSRRDSAPGAFHYPRGLALGCITHNGVDCPCVAICDSWNGRIQFLDVEGRFLTFWNEARGLAMNEPSDIRFVERSKETEYGGAYWLVLDRGNHRMCALDKKGGFLFQVGREWPPSERYRWSEPRLLSASNSVEPKGWPAYRPFDGLYYPERILGTIEDCVVLWEASSKTCQIVSGGNVIPLPSKAYPDGAWIAADNEGMVEWSPLQSRLRWRALDGTSLGELEIAGRPLPSNLPSAHVWIQQDRTLTIITHKGDPHTPCSSGACAPLLLQAATGAMERLDAVQLEESALSLRTLVKEMKALGRRAVGMMDGVNDDPTEDLSDAGERIEKLARQFHGCARTIQESAHLLSVAALAMRLSNVVDEETCAPDAVSSWGNTSQLLTSAVYEAFLNIVEERDDIELRIWLLSSKRFNQRSANPRLPPFLELLQSSLETMKSRLHCWCIPSRHPAREAARPMGMTGGPVGPNSCGLVEISRVQLGDVPDSALAGPLYMTSSGRDTFFVSLYDSGHVAEMTRDCRIIYLVGPEKFGQGNFRGPSGLAVDERRRLWVAEATAGQIRIIDPPYNDTGRILSIDEGLLSLPIGLCPMPGGILAADAKENLLLRISLDGQVEVVIDAVGRGVNQLRCPTTLSPDSSLAAGFWVVDKLNHRLQHLDADLHVTRQVGGLGLGKGKLYYPCGVGHFEDGLLLVSQQQEPCAFKIFDESGEETKSLYIDYCPSGILVQADKAYIGDIYGNCIRVYERR